MPNLFDALKGRLGPVEDDDQTPYAELGASLRLSEGAVKVAVHRMRKRCRELIRDEIATTVATPDEVPGLPGARRRKPAELAASFQQLEILELVGQA